MAPQRLTEELFRVIMYKNKALIRADGGGKFNENDI